MPILKGCCVKCLEHCPGPGRQSTCIITETKTLCAFWSRWQAPEQEYAESQQRASGTSKRSGSPGPISFHQGARACEEMSSASGWDPPWQLSQLGRPPLPRGPHPGSAWSQIWAAGALGFLLTVPPRARGLRFFTQTRWQWQLFAELLRESLGRCLGGTWPRVHPHRSPAPTSHRSLGPGLGSAPPGPERPTGRQRRAGERTGHFRLKDSLGGLPSSPPVRHSGSKSYSPAAAEGPGSTMTPQLQFFFKGRARSQGRRVTHAPTLIGSRGFETRQSEAGEGGTKGNRRVVVGSARQITQGALWLENVQWASSWHWGRVIEWEAKPHF